MSDSYKIYASKDYVNERGLPQDAGEYKQLVTDADGNVAWEDRLGYKSKIEVKVWMSNSDGVFYIERGDEVSTRSTADVNGLLLKVTDNPILDEYVKQVKCVLADGTEVILWGEGVGTTVTDAVTYHPGYFANVRVAGAQAEDISGSSITLDEVGFYLNVITFMAEGAAVYFPDTEIHPIPAEYITGTTVTDADNSKVLGVVESSVGLIEGIATETYVNTQIANQTTETWTFTLADGTTVTKTVVVK